MIDFPRHACRYAERLADTCEPFRLQLEPDGREFDEEEGYSADPFGETGETSGVHGLKQRFEDRVLVMTSDSCFMNCRHCTRKGILESAEVVRSDGELQDCLLSRWMSCVFARVRHASIPSASPEISQNG